MSRSYSITYEVWTPEDVEHGEPSERGFIIDGWETEMPPGIVGKEATKWFKENDPDMDVDEDIRDLADEEDISLKEASAVYMADLICSELGFVEPSSSYLDAESYYGADDEPDYSTGNRTTKALHLKGFSKEEREAILRELARKGCASIFGLM